MRIGVAKILILKRQQNSFMVLESCSKKLLRIFSHLSVHKTTIYLGKFFCYKFVELSNSYYYRITSMVEKLAQFYGKKICDYNGTTYYSFPNVESLANDEVEQTLRENGFGYRSKYISQSAKYITEHGGDQWVKQLKFMKYEEAKKELINLMGIGAKVADCICLMSLGHLQAIPVDTHIYQIAARWYMPKLAKQKTVTEKIYNEIGDYFRELYGPLAGWAHTV